MIMPWLDNAMILPVLFCFDSAAERDWQSRSFFFVDKRRDRLIVFSRTNRLRQKSEGRDFEGRVADRTSGLTTGESSKSSLRSVFPV